MVVSSADKERERLGAQREGCWVLPMVSDLFWMLVAQVCSLCGPRCRLWRCVLFMQRCYICIEKFTSEKKTLHTPPKSNLISLNDHKAAPRRYLSPASPARPTVQLGRLFHGTGLCLLLFLPPSHFPSGGLSSSDLL